MILKIQSVRFSKDYFDSLEMCLKWLEGKGLSSSTHMELDKFYVFNQVSKDKLVEVSLQEYNLDAGVVALIGLPNESDSESLEGVIDNEPVVIQDEATQLKDTLNNFVDNISNLANEMKVSINVTKKQTKKITKELAENEHEFEFHVPIYKALEEDGDERIAMGPVLIPDEEDGQGQIYDKKAVEDACHFWMEQFQQMTEMHTEELEEKQYAVLECYIAPVDFVLNGNDVKEGTWLLMIRVNDDDLWQQIKDGELNAFSIGGVATVEELEEEE